MGIKSLTTYLENRSTQYFEDFQLHDCNLIIDGSSLCYNLYNWNYSFFKTGYSYDCYGGDCDKYAETVRIFFQMLQACNVDPYIVFGGRNGIDRVSMIKQRLEETMKTAMEITPDVIRCKLLDSTNPGRGFPARNKPSFPNSRFPAQDKPSFSKSRFPARNKPSFPNSRFPAQDKPSFPKSRFPARNKPSFPNSRLPTKNKSMAPRTGFVPQRRPTSVTVKYVFRDVLTELNLKMFTCEEDPNREIACLAKELVCPVLSANSDFFVLGSDFITFSSLGSQIEVNNTNWRNSSKKFFQYIPCKVYKIEHLLEALNKRPNNNFIPYLIPVLLGSEYIEDIFEPFFKRSGIKGRYRQEKIDNIFAWIKAQNSLEGALKKILECFNDEEEKKRVTEQINHATIGYSPVPITLLLEHFNIKAKNKETDVNRENTGSELFMKRHRECRYPSVLIDMLKENRYFLQCNIDDCNKPDANSIGYTIMAAMHNILVQNAEKRLTVFRRSHDLRLEEYVLPVVEEQLPSIDEIDYLRVESRLDILLRVLEIDGNFRQVFNDLPKEWHLFLLSLKYTKLKSEMDSSFEYALIMCFIILNFVDTNLEGFYRTVNDIKHIHEEDRSDSNIQNEEKQFPKISAKDSIIFMENYVKYFEMSENDNNKTYDRGIMHSIAEFQCVFLHLKYLNNLLDFPIQNSFIYKIFDNTFIYNMTKKLRNVPSLKNYLNDLLKDCSTIRSGFLYVIDTLERKSVLL